MEKCRTNKKCSLNWFTYLTLYVVLSIALLFPLLIWLPFSIYRFAIILLVKVVRSRFGSILNSWDTIKADDLLNKKPTWSILALLEIQGHLSLENVKSALDKTLNLKDEETKQFYRFQKLQQYPANVLGYWFWKNDKHFKVDNHLEVIEYNRLVVEADYNIETLSKIHQKLLNCPFPQCRSPWDLTLITNIKESHNTTNSYKTLLAFRIHHCLGDGKSMVKLLVEGLGGSRIKTASPSKTVLKNETIYSRINSLLTTTIMFYPALINLTIKTFLVKWSTSQHPWRVHNYKYDDSHMIVRHSSIIPMAYIKEISAKSNNQVSTSGIILTSIAESIKISLRQDKFYWKDMTFLFILPKPRHPNYLTNHFDTGTLILSNFERKYENVLQDVHRSYFELRDNDLEGLCSRVLLRFAAALPRPVRSKLPLFSTFVKAISNVAGNDVEFSIEGHPCTGISMSVVPAKCSIGVTFLIFSYKRSLQVCVISKGTALPENKCQELADLIGIQISKLRDADLNGFVAAFDNFV